MNARKISAFEEELGKAICDRLGLPHGSTLRDYSTEAAGKTVWLTMTVMQAIPLDDYNELRMVASRRADS